MEPAGPQPAPPDRNAPPALPPFYRIESFRQEIFFTVIFNVLMAPLCFLPDFPFAPGFVWIVAASFVLHAVYYAAFPYLRDYLPSALLALTYVNITLLAFVIHFSGGIVSPFLFMFLMVLISRAAYGADCTYGVLASGAAYLAVVLAEGSGLVEPARVTARAVYGSPLVLAFLVCNFLAAIYMAGFIYRTLFRSLLDQLRTEAGQRQAMLLKLAALEGPSQFALVAAKIAHDIRGFAGGVMGFIALLQAEDLNPASREDLACSRRELDRIVRLSGQIMSLGRAGRPEPGQVDMRELIEICVRVASHLPKAGQVRFSSRFAAPGPQPVKGREDQLLQAYFNLLKNALEAALSSPAPRAVEVAAGRDEGRVTVAVRDSGPGFPTELFERLVLEPVTTKKEGNGLGLMIVNEILSSHGGGLALGNRAGGGAEVRTWLPLDAAGEAPPEGGEPRRPDADNEGSSTNK